MPPACPASVAPCRPADAFARGRAHAYRWCSLAWGRSGDKGDAANIGIIARRRRVPALYPCGPHRSRPWHDYFAHAVKGPVLRYDLPGIQALNFLMHEALGGGGIASVRMDPQAKAFAQMLLDFPVPIPADLAL
jgi:hypothetical protein